MKRKNWLSILCCGIMALNTISCQDSTGTENTGGSGDGAIVITSEDAQKELDRVGKDLMQNINLEKVKPVVELTDFCLHEFPEFQDAIDEIPVYFIMRQTQNVIDGDLTSIATKQFVRSMYHYSDYFGTYEWNGQEWEKRENNKNLELLFTHDGKSCKVLIEKNGNDLTIDDQTFFPENGLEEDVIVIPQTVSAKVYEDDRLMVGITLDTKKFENKDYLIDTELNILDYYRATGSLTSNSSQAGIAATLKVEDKTLLSAELQANGENMADYDQMINNSMDYNDIHAVSMTLNIMNSVQLKASSSKPSVLVDSLKFDGEYYVYSVNKNGKDSVIYASYQTKEEAKIKATQAAKTATNHLSSALYFKNSTYTAPVKWEAYFDEYYNDTYTWDGATYHDEAGSWEIEPIIIFDGHSYSFGQFFTESRFQSLIDTFEDLCKEADRLYN